MYTESQQSLFRRIHGMLDFQQMRQKEQLSDAVRSLIAEGGISADTVARSLGHPVTVVLNWADQKNLPEQETLPGLQRSIISLIETELERAEKPVQH